MIDFRYHVVSIVAVFLALATGIVLGSTVLQKPALKTAQGTASSMQQKNADLRRQLLALQQQQRASEGFASASAPTLLANQLSAKRIVVVAAPGADGDQVDSLRKSVKQAGGTVTGTVTLKDGYVQQQQVGVLGGLTDTLAKNTKVAIPADAVPAERAAILLAHAMATRDKTTLGKSDDVGNSILSTFKEAKFLSVDGTPQNHADLAVVVGPTQPYPSKGASASNSAIVALAKQLDVAGSGSVLTAPTPSAGPDGVVAALRGDDDAKKRVSSVDNLDAPAGTVVSILALALDGGGKVGQWGAGTGADGVAPTPTPAPATSKAP
ncbi:MAG: copper transporter [Streptosporangiales bacterium]|nr:copper transporter [Streptosporangiales bacterium]MBO0892205.1 copper transporter [Acidothermales bacterium]